MWVSLWTTEHPGDLPNNIMLSLRVFMDNWTATWKNIQHELCPLFSVCLCGGSCRQLHVYLMQNAHRWSIWMRENGFHFPEWLHSPLCLTQVSTMFFSLATTPPKLHHIIFSSTLFLDCLPRCLSSKNDARAHTVLIGSNVLQMAKTLNVSIFQNDCTLPCVWRRCPPCFFSLATTPPKLHHIIFSSTLFLDFFCF